MRSWPIIASLWMLSILAPVGHTEGSEDVAAEVTRLVRELDSNKLAERQAAEKALIDLGPEAKALLPEVTPRMAAEVKERLGRVRTALEMAVAESAARPSVINIDGEMTIAEAFAAIEEQSGNKVEGFEQSGDKSSFLFQSTPYWEAVDQLLDEAQLGINPYAGVPNTLVVTARSDTEQRRHGRAAYSGVFRFEVQRIVTTRDLRNPATDNMRITMNIAWEPRVVPIVIRQLRDSLVLTDDRGQVIAPSDGRSVFSASPAEHTISEVELVIPFQLPGRDAAKIASLKGSMTALVPGSKQAFEFADIANARDVEQRSAGVAVTFDRMRKNGDLYEVRMRARYENAAEALQSNRGWVYNNEAYLLDENGNRVEPLNPSGNVGDNEVRMSYLFPLQDGPDGYRFVYRTPTSMLRLPVEYELTDIELP